MLRALIAIALLLAVPADRAAAADKGTYLRYEVYWGGLRAANFVLALDRTPESYRHEFVLRSSGFTEWVFKLDINASSRGRFHAPSQPQPAAYRTDFINRWRKGWIDVRYELGQGTGPRTAHVTDWADPPRRYDDDDERPEPVGEDAKIEGLDPLAAFAEALRQTGTAMSSGMGAFRVPIFDGRRRYDVTGTPLGAVDMSVLGEKRQVQHLRLNVVPVAGFTGRQRTTWSERVFEVFVRPSQRPDGEPTPVRIEADGLGPIINLIAECPDRAACSLAPRATEDRRPSDQRSPAG